MLDSLANLENNKETTPMSESRLHVLGDPPSPVWQGALTSTTFSTESIPATSLSEDQIPFTNRVSPADASDFHSCDGMLFKSPVAVQIEEVLDEEFVRHIRSAASQNQSIISPSLDYSHSPMRPQEQGPLEDAYINMESEVFVDEASDVCAEVRPPVSVEEILDEDFTADAHPNVSTTNAICDYGLDTGATLAWRDDPVDTPTRDSKQSPKRVRFADASMKPEVSATKWEPDDLRFIFFRETRDFNSYHELQESYQALIDESVDFSKPENTTTFITHSPYTPPATMFDLQYYRVPASYYHSFWHPQRVPIYLHGNVFDGISLTNWIYNWTAYTFKDNSYQMDAVRRFGQTVVKLGSALSDIEQARPAVKAKLPKDLYDESGVLWADLENIINDIMSEAEDRLEASKQSGRLEVEFVSRFCHELIAGNQYYRPIEKFLKTTEKWCKMARFHPKFIMLWELWES